MTTVIICWALDETSEGVPVSPAARYKPAALKHTFITSVPLIHDFSVAPDIRHVTLRDGG